MSSELLGSVPVIIRSGGPAAHQQIVRWLVTAIGDGRLARGEQLPSERVLAQALGVSRMTLRQALGELKRRGVIAGVDGSPGRAFVMREAVDVDLTELVGLSEQIMRGNQRAGARVETARTVVGDAAVCSALRVDVGSLVHEVVRVRLADDVPVAVEHSFFPEGRFPDMLDQDLRGSMYELLGAKYAAAPVSALETLAPGSAMVKEAALLAVSRRSPVLRIDRVAYAVDRRPVEFSRDVFRPDRVRLSVRSSLRLGVGTLDTGLDTVQPPPALDASMAWSGSSASNARSSPEIT